MSETHPSPLFEDISPEEAETLLSCFNAEQLHAAKDTFILLEGDSAGKIGLVKSGSVRILKEEMNGVRSIIGVAGPGEMFAEAFALTGLPEMPVSVQAAEDTECLMFPVAKLLAPCSKACSFHQTMIRNLLRIVASKNIQMNKKLRILAHKTTREKLLAYLTDQAKQAHSRTFTIPLSRQDLADYIGAERSAMSAELGKLVKEGVLRTRKNSFELLI